MSTSHAHTMLEFEAFWVKAGVFSLQECVQQGTKQCLARTLENMLWTPIDLPGTINMTIAMGTCHVNLVNFTGCDAIALNSPIWKTRQMMTGRYTICSMALTSCVWQVNTHTLINSYKMTNDGMLGGRIVTRSKLLIYYFRRGELLAHILNIVSNLRSSSEIDY